MTFDAWRELYLADPVRFHALAKATRPASWAQTQETDWLLADHWTSIGPAERAQVCTRRHATGPSWHKQPCHQAHLDAARAWSSARG